VKFQHYLADPSEFTVCVLSPAAIVCSNHAGGMDVSYECCELSGRGLCYGLITCPEDSYRLWCVCDCEASIMRRPWPTGGCCALWEGGGRKYKLRISFFSVFPNYSL